MYLTPALVLFFLLTLGLYGQPKTAIFYRETGSLDFDFLRAESEKHQKEEGRDTANKEEEVITREALLQAMEELSAGMADTIKAWKEGNFIITNSSTDGPGKRMLYELPSKRFVVVDTSNRKALVTRDTIYSEVFDCKGIPDCSITFTLQKQNGEKDILGYTCVNYTIGAKNTDGTGRENSQSGSRTKYSQPYRRTH